MPASRSLSVSAIADHDGISTNDDAVMSSSDIEQKKIAKSDSCDGVNHLYPAMKGSLVRSSSHPTLSSQNSLTLLSPYVKHAVSVHPCRLKKNAKRKKLLVTANLAATKYSLVRRACLESGMVVTEGATWEDCLLVWSDSAVSAETISDLKSYQKINHFPGMGEICRKDNLARNLSKMAKIYPEEYRFFPKTWVFPGDYTSFSTHHKDVKRRKKQKTYIVKPTNGAMGHGIWLTRNIDRLHPYESCIVQEYIDKPLLMDGYKFDLRLYVLVTSCDPLRIFLYNDGLVRMTTEKYQPPSEANLTCQFMHLTNYSINKHSEAFINTTEEDLGTKRTLTHFKEWLKDQDQNFDFLWANISDVIVKTLLVAEPHLFHAYHMCRPSDSVPNNSVCFEILGFDILLDRKFMPWIIEINRAPSFGADQTLDFDVKKGVLFDAIKLLDIRITNKRKRLAAEKAEARQRLTRPLQRKELEMTAAEKRKKILHQRKIELRQRLAQIRSDAALEDRERANMGNYRRIYPPYDRVKCEKYKALLDSASKAITGRTPLRRKGDKPFQSLKEHELLDLLEQVENDEDVADPANHLTVGFRPLSSLPLSKASSKSLKSSTGQDPGDQAVNSRPTSAVGSPSRSSSIPRKCNRERPSSHRSISSSTSTATRISAVTDNSGSANDNENKADDLCRQTLRALQCMRIKFPGKSDEEADKLLEEIQDNWKFHKSRVATYWLVKLDANKRKKVIDIVQGNVKAILQRIWKVPNLDTLRLNRIFTKLFNRLLWSHGQGLWACYNAVGDTWESIFHKNSELLTQIEMHCCRRVVQLCKDCLLVVYQFASEARISTLSSAASEVDSSVSHSKPTTESRHPSKPSSVNLLSMRLARLYKGN